MKIVIIAFTRQGGAILKRLLAGFERFSYEADGYIKREYLETEDRGPEKQTFDGGRLHALEETAAQWTKRFFQAGCGLIYVGATGIAVRLIAPLLRGKAQDPAVTVIDQKGRFCISLLSGHMGGANTLSQLSAEILQAVPVITTATDIDGTFSVDLFAKENQLAIGELSLVKGISASLLDGCEVGFFSELPVGGVCPPGLLRDRVKCQNIFITIYKKCAALSRLREREMLCDNVLFLIPRAVVVGVGCRKGVTEEAVTSAVEEVLLSCGIENRAVACIASIDLKKEEQALLNLKKAWKTDFYTFSAAQLSAVSGEFSQSEFVRDVTGVSNVCERAAVCGCMGEGRLLVKKRVFPGVTVALALKELSLHFGKEEKGGQT